MTRLACLLLSSLLLSCAVEPDGLSGPPDTADDSGGKADGPTGAPAGTRSHVADAVVAALEATAAGEYGRTWSISDDNRLDGGWLVQTPTASHWGLPYAQMAQARTCTSGAGCDLDFGVRTCNVDADCGAAGQCTTLAATRRAPTETARKLCVGHSDALLDELHGLITSATTTVDLTSLQPPDGRFEAALRNAITFLGKSGRKVEVRLLFGAFPVQGVVDAKAVLTRLTRDLPSSSQVTVFVGNYRSSNLPPSWNHSKIVAVDGKAALVGGHNLWTQHYLGVEPVHDLSIRVTGPAARDAQRFSDVQWRWTCANRSWVTRRTGSVAAFRWRGARIDDTCPATRTLLTTTGTGDVTVIGVGRLAWVDGQDDANQADLALVAMLEEARSSIRISQQDLGPVELPVIGLPISGWDEEVLDALAAALLRGVDVAIVVSSPEAAVGGLGPSQAPYANGWTLDEVAAEIRSHVEDQPGAPSAATIDAALCARLHVAPVRFSSDDRFPGGGAPGNHAKLVMVDDVAFYVGSQNLYPAGLTEYGYIVDDAAAAATLRTGYWAPLWAQSSRFAVSGASCAR